MQIILINGGVQAPGFGRYPGCYRLATELRAQGFTVQVIDFFHRLDFNDFYRLIDSLITDDTLFLGWSSTFSMRLVGNRPGGTKKFQLAPQYTHRWENVEIRPFFFDKNEMSQVFDLVKKRNIQFIVGGSEDRKYYDEYPVDYFFYGQADLAIVEFAKCLRDKQVPKARLELSAKGKKRKILHQDDYVFKHFQTSTIEWHESDHILYGEALPMEVARGCIFKCTYCNYQLNGKTKNDYVKERDILHREILTAYEKFGTKEFMISDDLFNDTKEKIYMWHEIANMLPFQLEWSSYIRLDMIHAMPETSKILLDSGLRSCLFGIETFDDLAGKRVGKGLGKKRILETLERVKKDWGDVVRTSSGFIIGLPGETTESNLNTFDWAMSTDLLDTFYFNPLMVFKNELETTIQSFGQDLSKYGYRIKPGGLLYELWENDITSYEEAADLSWEFYLTQKRSKKYSAPNFTMPMRVKNLGIEFTNETWVRDQQLLIAKTMEKELEYFSKLFTSLGLTPPTSVNSGAIK